MGATCSSAEDVLFAVMHLILEGQEFLNQLRVHQNIKMNFTSWSQCTSLTIETDHVNETTHVYDLKEILCQKACVIQRSQA
jgi:hypothetical protein